MLERSICFVIWNFYESDYENGVFDGVRSLLKRIKNVLVMYVYYIIDVVINIFGIQEQDIFVYLYEVVEDRSLLIKFK